MTCALGGILEPSSFEDPSVIGTLWVDYLEPWTRYPHLGQNAMILAYFRASGRLWTSCDFLDNEFAHGSEPNRPPNTP